MYYLSYLLLMTLSCVYHLHNYLSSIINSSVSVVQGPLSLWSLFCVYFYLVTKVRLFSLTGTSRVWLPCATCLSSTASTRCFQPSNIVTCDLQSSGSRTTQLNYRRRTTKNPRSYSMFYVSLQFCDGGATFTDILSHMWLVGWDLDTFDSWILDTVQLVASPSRALLFCKPA